MATLHSTFLRFSAVLSAVVALWNGGDLQAAVHDDVAAGLSRLDYAVCHQQWEQAIAVTSGLMASPHISSDYRQTLLGFRQQLQTWRVSATPPSSQASCDRALPLLLTLAEPDAPQPQPLDWNSALASFRSVRPIIQLDDGFEPTDNIIPQELTDSSPEILTSFATPIDTTDGFSVVGGTLARNQQVFSFLARLGDQVSLEAEVTRSNGPGAPQLWLFDQRGQLLAQSDNDSFQALIPAVAAPQTDVYFAALVPQGSTPILDTQGQIVDWQLSDGAGFDYTLTLTGVTPYQVLVP
ncbi:MAG: hypothetical protein AAGI69_00710 [Cyanobacteria bacterium P01_H01_bin.21]